MLYKMVDGVEVQLTEVEEAEILEFWEANALQASVDTLKEQALAVIVENDKTLSRTLKQGLIFNTEWQAYDLALHEVLKTGVGPLPTIPAFYPDGAST